MRRLRELWRRLEVRGDEDLAVVLNRTSRKLEVQPDLARKVVGGTLAQTTIPDDFAAFETAVNTGSPVRMEDPKLRGAFDALAVELAALPGVEEPEPAGGESRGLLARLGGERGQSSAEAMGLLPILLVFVLGLWQLGLVGYTYVLAGHAAREGARELATDPTNEKYDKPFRRVALEDLPKAWREGADITAPSEEVVTVKVRLAVPIVLPGLRSPFHVGSDASTSVESEDLPPSQALTPESS